MNSFLVVLLVLLILLTVGGVPHWGYPHRWGYYPSGIGLMLIILVIVVLFYGRV